MSAAGPDAGEPARGVRAVIALGSNLGDRERTLADAIHRIADLDGVELTAISSFLDTTAVRAAGVDPDAPRYLNAVVLVRTELEPLQLLHALHAIERAHGRVRAERWGDRTLDLDIVDLDGRLSITDELTLPHPRAIERDFVLRPWLEVDPDAVLPGFGRVDALPAARGGDRS